MRSSLRLWLRLTWKGLLGWTLGSGVMFTVVLAAYKVAVPNPADAARFAATLEPFAKTFEVILGKAEALGTPGGFITWRLLGVLPVIVAIYAIFLATRMTLAEERRGTSDLALSTPLTRRALLAGQGLSLVVVSLVVGVGGALVGWAGARGLGIDLGGAAAAVGAGLDVGLLVLCWAAIAGLVAQYARSRSSAAAITTTLMLVAFLVTNVGEAGGAFRMLAWLSPFTFYKESRPLVPGHGLVAWALLVLAAAAVVAWVLAGVVLERRDLNCIGSGRLFRRRREADASRLLRGPLSRDLWGARGSVFAWALGLSAYLALFILLEEPLRKPVNDFLKNAGVLGDLLAKAFLGTQSMAAIFFGGFAGPVLAVFGVLAVSRWSGEVGEGLLTMDLSTPVSRARLLLSRAAAALAAAAIALAAAWCVTTLVALMRGVTLPGLDLARGMTASLCVALVFMGIGLVVGSWGRLSWGAPVAGALAAANFAFDLLSQAAKWPSWTQKVSIFARLGNPVREPLAWSKEGVLLLAGLALVGLAVAGFARKDLTE